MEEEHVATGTYDRRDVSDSGRWVRCIEFVGAEQMKGFSLPRVDVVNSWMIAQEKL